MRHTFVFLIVLVALFNVRVYGQTGLIENSQGQALFLINYNTPSQVSANINTSDESLRLNALLTKGNKSPKYYFIDLKGKAVNGVSNIYQNSKFNAGASINGIYGWTHFLTDPAGANADFMFIKVGYQVSKFNFYYPDSAFKKQLSDKSFGSLSINLNYARFFNLVNNKQFLFSLNLGYARASNYDNLDKVDIKDTKSYIDSNGLVRSATSNTVSARTVKKNSTYNEFDSYPLTISITKFPEGGKETAKYLKLGYSLYYYTTFYSGKITPRNNSNLGFNLFLTSGIEKDPDAEGQRKVIGGIFAEFKDVFDQTQTGSGLGSRFVVGLNARISLNIMK